MPIQVTPLTEPDIQGAITTIQLAFADDPYNRWVYNDRSKVNLSVYIVFSATKSLSPTHTQNIPRQSNMRAFQQVTL